MSKGKLEFRVARECCVDVSRLGGCVQYKLAKVRAQKVGDRGIPYISTSDGRTIRYPDPLIKVNDTVKIDIETGKVIDHIKFDVGNIVMITGGRNRGRVGILQVRLAKRMWEICVRQPFERGALGLHRAITICY